MSSQLGPATCHLASCLIRAGAAHTNLSPLLWDGRLLPTGTVMADLSNQLDAPEKRDPQIKNCLHQIGLQPLPWGAFSQLLMDAGGPSTLKRGAIPRQVILGYMQKKRLSKPGAERE